MTRWEVFSALCDRIRSGMFGGRVGLGRRATWQELFAEARVHVVVPSLAWCLRDEKAVPPEFRSYVDAVTRLNTKRNNRLCRQLEQIAGALNDIDIEPTLLKGAAHLVANVYPSSAARLMGDLDILVPQERAMDAFAAMKSIGFAFEQTAPDNHHHLPQLRHVENDIVIELHTRLLHQRSEPIVPVSWVHEQSRSIPFAGSRVKIPSPTILIAHNIVHDQLNHERYAWKQVELRQLLDFAIIRDRHEAEIDWAELDRRFSNVGLGHMLATYLVYNRALFRQRMPAIRSAPRKHAMRRLRHAMDFPLRERPIRRAEQRAKEEARQLAERQAREAREQARVQARMARQQAREQARMERRQIREQARWERQQARAEIRLAREGRRQVRRARYGQWMRRVGMVITLPWYYASARWRDPAGLARLLDRQAWASRFRSVMRGLKEMR